MQGKRVRGEGGWCGSYIDISVLLENSTTSTAAAGAITVMAIMALPHSDDQTRIRWQ